MNFVIGLVIAVGSMIGGYAALGGHLEVLVQPFEFLIIGGSSLGMFIVANPLPTIKDCGKAIVEAITDKAPKPRDYPRRAQRAARADARAAGQVAQRGRGPFRQPEGVARSSRAFRACSPTPISSPSSATTAA